MLLMLLLLLLLQPVLLKFCAHSKTGTNAAQTLLLLPLRFDVLSDATLTSCDAEELL